MNNSQVIISGIETGQLLDAFRQIVRDELSAIPKPQKQKEFLSISELADLLSISKQTVYSLTSRKAIPFIKRGGRVLFDRSEVDQWLAASRQPIQE